MLLRELRDRPSENLSTNYRESNLLMKMGQSSAEKARKAINVAEIWSKVSHLLSTKKFWMELLVMTVGMFVASSAVHFFQVPSKLVIGSFSGLALVVYQLFPIVSVGTYLLLINIVLLILSFILLGNEFGAKTVYTSLIVGPMVDFLQWLFPMKQSRFAVTSAGTGQVRLDPWFDLLCFVLVLGLSQSILLASTPRREASISWRRSSISTAISTSAPRSWSVAASSAPWPFSSTTSQWCSWV